MAFAAFTVVSALLSSCVGDGMGLDEFGDPLDSLSTSNEENGGSIVIKGTLESIQANIFNAICAIKCHKAPRPKKGLNLEEGKAYSHLVDVESEEKPTMMRVKPFDSENSYIIWKLEGRDGISGKRMPLNQAPLEDTQIEAMKSWIDGGALP